jgi:hypothetical protein
MTIDLEQKWGFRAPCGVSIGAGWVPLVDELIANLVLKDFDVNNIAQIKEKFGELRFYIHNPTIEHLDLIDEAEERSATICEDCGSAGRLDANSRGWMATLCDSCHAKREERFR